MGWGFAKPSFEYDVAFGRARGHKPAFVVGNSEARNTSQHTIWDLTNRTITFLESAQELFVSSTSTSDVNCTITVAGLDNDWVEKRETVQLNGQNAVSVGDFRIVNRAVILSVGAVGNVYIATAGSLTAGVPDDLTTVQSYIIAGQNLTHNGFYGVPKGKALVAIAIRAGTDATNKTAKIRTFFKKEGEPAVQFVNYYVLPSFAQYFFPAPFAASDEFTSPSFAPFVPEKSILFYTSQPANSGTDIFFGVDCIIVDLADFGPVV